MVRSNDIKEEILFLEKAIESNNSELEKLNKMILEKGRLRVARHGKNFQYFIRKEGSGSNGEYIKRDNIKFAEMLAQIEYDEKLKRVLQEKLDNLKKLKTYYVDDVFDYVADQMIPGKRELIKEPYVSDEKYVNAWKQQNYERLLFKEDYPEFYTRQGLRVRSKSEVIIADILDEMSIPFLYEKPLQLKVETVHPDFTLLNIQNRKELYWEHFGMLDDIEYRNNAFMKIREYESNGLYQYDSVIWTFETGRYPINTKVIREMISRLKDLLGY